LTKLHEEIWRGNLSQALAYFQSQPPRGEFTLVVGGKPAQIKHYSEEEIKQAIQDGLRQAIPPAQLAAQLSSASGLPRRELYALITQHTSNQEKD
jgi:16S rRNA (cytidine1402-2'-O)-methyltransferase